MPDPLLYVKSLGSAAAVGALVALTAAVWRNSPRAVVAVSVLALAAGFIAGVWQLGWGWRWPPSSALDRLMTVLIPAGFAVELVGGCFAAPSRRLDFGRLALVLLAPFVLLFGSVHFEESGIAQIALLLTFCSAEFAVPLFSLTLLARRAPSSFSISLALCLSQMSAGLAILLAGYIKGGAIVFPLCGALFAVSLLLFYMAPSLGEHLAALGSLQLWGVIGVGCFFGRLPISSAIALACAPCLCWITEIRPVRNYLQRANRAWLLGLVRQLAVAIPLLIVLWFSKQQFDRTMRPLVSQNTGASSAASIAFPL